MPVFDSVSLPVVVVQDEVVCVTHEEDILLLLLLLSFFEKRRRPSLISVFFIVNFFVPKKDRYLSIFFSSLVSLSLRDGSKMKHLEKRPSFSWSEGMQVKSCESGLQEKKSKREEEEGKLKIMHEEKKYQVQREFCLWLQSFFLLFLWTQKKRMKSLTPSSWLFKDKKPTLKEIPAEKTKLRRQSKWRKRHQRWYHQIQLLFLFLTSVFLESGSLYSHWHVHHIIIKSERDIRTMMMMVVEPKTGKGIFLDKV